MQGGHTQIERQRGDWTRIPHSFLSAQCWKPKQSRELWTSRTYTTKYPLECFIWSTQDMKWVCSLGPVTPVPAHHLWISWLSDLMMRWTRAQMLQGCSQPACLNTCSQSTPWNSIPKLRSEIFSLHIPPIALYAMETSHGPGSQLQLFVPIHTSSRL